METHPGNPTITTIPNLFLDRWLRTLTGDELKVMLYVVRHSEDILRADGDLEIADIVQGTGLKRLTVQRALKVLVAATGYAETFRVGPKEVSSRSDEGAAS